jgi:5'-3' exonuclease
MLEGGATHVGVATDHVIESFRNALWPTYKTGAGIDPDLFAQFHPLEDALAAMGVAVWPMIELEADDALASAAHLAAADARVEKVCIWTPDKDLAQCVVDDRVVQVDRRGNQGRGDVRDATKVIDKFGVAPPYIPDYLALVGDSADGYPGIPGYGAKTAARLITRHGHLEDFPANILGAHHDDALLFKRLATLRTDAPLFANVDALLWRGPTPAFASLIPTLGDTRLTARLAALSPESRPASS